MKRAIAVIVVCSMLVAASGCYTSGAGSVASRADGHQVVTYRQDPYYGREGQATAQALTGLALGMSKKAPTAKQYRAAQGFQGLGTLFDLANR